MSEIINLCDRWENELNNYLSVSKHVLVGSYSCVNYLRYLVGYLIKRGWSNVKYDIVLPVFAENQLDYLKNDAMKMVLENSNRIVINDVGMLDYMKDYTNIRLGRLFFKDYKDKRYEEYDEGEYTLKSLSVLSGLEKLGYNINEIECDCVSRKFKIDHKNDVKIYVHFPYRQIACAHICEFSAIGKEVKEKFLPDDTCSMQCKKVMVKTENPKYVKVGKCVYDTIDEKYLDALMDEYEVIVTPRW